MFWTTVSNFWPKKAPQPIRGTNKDFFKVVCFGFFFDIQLTSTVFPGWWEGGWTRPDLASFASCAQEPTGKICAVWCCCWDWVAGAGSQQVALGACSLAVIKLGRRWKAKDSQHAGQRHQGQRASCSGSQDVPLAPARCPQGWFNHMLVVTLLLLFHWWGLPGESPGAKLGSAGMPHLCPATSSPRDLPGLQGLDWSLQTPEPVSQQMAFSLSWKPWLN